MKSIRRFLRSGSVLAILVVGVFFMSFLASCASGQPHMQSALDHLVAARHELQSATADKGGHRVRAIALIDEAVTEVERGLEYARGR